MAMMRAKHKTAQQPAKPKEKVESSANILEESINRAKEINDPSPVRITPKEIPQQTIARPASKRRQTHETKVEIERDVQVEVAEVPKIQTKSLNRRKSKARTPSPGKRFEKIKRKVAKPSRIMSYARKFAVGLIFMLAIYLFQDKITERFSLPFPETISQIRQYSPLELENKKDMITHENKEIVDELTSKMQTKFGPGYVNEKSLEELWEAYVQVKKDANLQVIMIISFLVGIIFADYMM